MSNNLIEYKIAVSILRTRGQKSVIIGLNLGIILVLQSTTLFCKQRWLGRIDTWESLRQICKCLGGAVNQHWFRFIIRFE